MLSPETGWISSSWRSSVPRAAYPRETCTMKSAGSPCTVQSSGPNHTSGMRVHAPTPNWLPSSSSVAAISSTTHASWMIGPSAMLMSLLAVRASGVLAGLRWLVVEGPLDEPGKGCLAGGERVQGGSTVAAAQATLDPRVSRADVVPDGGLVEVHELHAGLLGRVAHLVAQAQVHGPEGGPVLRSHQGQTGTVAALRQQLGIADQQDAGLGSLV